MKLKYTALAIAAPLLMNAQEVMTPETLWKLSKISVQGASPDHSLKFFFHSKSSCDTSSDMPLSISFSVLTLNSEPQ